MDVLQASLLVWTGSLLAGALGSLTGLGGGVVIVPLLTLVLGVDIRYAVGASLLGVIATSSGAAAAYVRDGFSNIRVALLLEIATTLGALGGAVLAGFVEPRLIAILFAAMLGVSALLSLQAPATRDGDGAPPDRLSAWFGLDSTFPGPNGAVAYRVRRVPAGFSLMALAGVLSGLLGIGSGALKVVAMDRVMRLPFKVSTTTSNFMIGVTAAASAGVYLSRGYLDPGLAFPVVLGVLPGALAGARWLPRARSRVLRVLFALAIGALAVQMLLRAGGAS